ADRLEIDIRVVDGVPHDLAEDSRDAVVVELGRRQDRAAREVERVRGAGRDCGQAGWRKDGGWDGYAHSVTQARDGNVSKRRWPSTGKLCLTSRWRTRSSSAEMQPLPRGSRFNMRPQQSTINVSP